MSMQKDAQPSKVTRPFASPTKQKGRQMLAQQTGSYHDSQRTADRNRLYGNIHNAFRKLGVTNTTEKRNIYRAIIGKRSLRAMTITELSKIKQFLWNEHAERNAEPSDPEPLEPLNRTVEEWLA